MIDLLFQYPVFEDYGVQVTVRNGNKWNETITRLPQRVTVKGVNGELSKPADVLGKMVLHSVDAIPQHILDLEHDPTCRNLDGLKKVLKGVYGDDWKSDSEVTVLFFRFMELG